MVAGGSEVVVVDGAVFVVDEDDVVDEVVLPLLKPAAKNVPVTPAASCDRLGWDVLLSVILAQLPVIVIGRTRFQLVAVTS